MTRPLEFHPVMNPFFPLAQGGGSSARPSQHFHKSGVATDEIDEIRPPLNTGRRGIKEILSRQCAVVMTIVESDSTSRLDGVEWLGAVRANSLPDRIKFAVFQVAEFEKSGQGKVAARVILRFVESNFASRDLIAVSSFLAALDASKLSTWSIVAALRSTFRARFIMPGWAPFLVRAKEVLASRQEPADRILYGLE